MLSAPSQTLYAEESEHQGRVTKSTAAERFDSLLKHNPWLQHAGVWLNSGGYGASLCV